MTRDAIMWNIRDKSREGVQEDRFSFGRTNWIKEPTRWNLLSTPEDLRRYHQTWTSANEKQLYCIWVDDIWGYKMNYEQH